MGSDFDKIFAPKNRHSYVKACGHLEVLYGDLWASVRCALVCTFLMEMDVFGQSELSSADAVDVRSVVPIL